MHIWPGSAIKLHQTYPTFVIEIEGNMIAIDLDVASQICLWNNNPQGESAKRKSAEDKVKKEPGGWTRLFDFGVKKRRMVDIK